MGGMYMSLCVCVRACVRVFYDFELLRCYVRFNIWLCVNVWEWTIALIFHWVEYSIMFPSAGFVWWLYQYLRNKISFSLQSPWAHLHVVGTLRFMSDINQPSLPTPFYSLLKSISVSVALSTVFSFHKFSRQLSVFSLCFCGLSSALFALSTIYLFMKVSFCPDIIPSGWLGSKHQLTN